MVEVGFLRTLVHAVVSWLPLPYVSQSGPACARPTQCVKSASAAQTNHHWIVYYSSSSSLRLHRILGSVSLVQPPNSRRATGGPWDSATTGGLMNSPLMSVSRGRHWRLPGIAACGLRHRTRRLPEVRERPAIRNRAVRHRDAAVRRLPPPCTCCLLYGGPFLETFDNSAPLAGHHTRWRGGGAR